MSKNSVVVNNKEKDAYIHNEKDEIERKNLNAMEDEQDKAALKETVLDCVG